METALSTLAQVFVGPLVGTISDHYVPAILEKIGIKWDVTEEMEKLSDILLTIQEVLEDAEDKQTTSKLIRRWLRKLKDVAYEVEDILDECATEALLDPESTGIIDKATMVERIKRFINKFEEIAEQRSKFNLINLTSTTRDVHYRVNPRRETSSFPTELKVYGRDEEIKDIVNLLVNNINAGNLSIYAIVGIGGLGKTTLAQMVYNDNMVESHFEIKRWICVSENFEVKSLIGDIIQSGSNNSSQTLDQLQRHLQEELSGKRFLLVLDDVWNEDPTKWSILKSSLTCGAKGSSIVVTTRSNRVASVMGFSHKWEPKMLTKEDCFSLFKHHAFDEVVEGEQYPNLESIGKEIVKKCGGVPLAAKALGGLLRFQREEKEWLFVKESKLWDLPQDKEDSILPALLLSYKHLPQHLRQCLAYCSIFPKDYRINKEVLIQLWMANGFLQPRGNMELEDIGNGIFNDLLWRGFFQEVIFDPLGNTISCKMHDLVHDLACSITRDDCFSVVVTDFAKELVVGRPNTTIRHLAIHRHILCSPNFSLSRIQSFLRTLFLLDKDRVYFTPDVPPPPLNFSNLIYLRVLDLSGSTCLKTLPESIASLKLLRYLDLSRTRIALLSDDVFGNLINLQTLKLRECPYLEMLPGNMRKLTNLRYVDISESTIKLVRMPVGMGQLKCLHTLSCFVVSDDSGCGVGELQELDHLGGTLEITCLWKVKDPREAENAKLSKKENIRSLRLDWCKSSTTTSPVPAESSETNSMNDEKLIADALQPHPNIERLGFYHYGGSDFPRWMNSKCLPSLVTLTLEDCSKCKHLPTLGLLPHLKQLFLTRIPVECIGNEFYCDDGEEGMVLFPALEKLELREMHSLEEWKEWSSSSRMKEGVVQVSVFPVLKTLKIWSCPNLRTFPSLPSSIQYLKIRYCSEKISLQILLLSLERLPHLSHLSIRKYRVEVSVKSSRIVKSFAIERCDGLKSLTNCLQLLTNLHELSIKDCPELELLPGDFQNLNALQKLEITDCPMLVSLPEIGTQSLTSLKYLTIINCDGLKSLTNCLQLLTNLHELRIDDCRELELLPDDFQNLVSLQSLRLRALPNLPEEGMQNLNALQKLEITVCPMLVSLPEIGTQSLTSLKSLEIYRCDGFKSFNNCLQLLTNLHKLTIRVCQELELLPDDFQNLVSLQSLYLDGLPKLEAVPVVGSSTLESITFSGCVGLKNLPEWITNQRSLHELLLDECENLKSLPEGLQHLTALQRLMIIGCPMLTSLPEEGMQNLTSLKYLDIGFCDGLKSLNNCLQRLTNLHELSISDCGELELLPNEFQNLVSLQSLHLRGLPKLEAVPVVGSSTLEFISFRECVGLKNLPEGLQRLTALQRLQIKYCHPELHRRCQKNTGEDWHKIAHIRGLELRL